MADYIIANRPIRTERRTDDWLARTATRPTIWETAPTEHEALARLRRTMGIVETHETLQRAEATR